MGTRTGQAHAAHLSLLASRHPGTEVPRKWTVAPASRYGAHRSDDGIRRTHACPM